VQQQPVAGELHRGNKELHSRRVRRESEAKG
jgi:hypothetical protein